MFDSHLTVTDININLHEKYSYYFIEPGFSHLYKTSGGVLTRNLFIVEVFYPDLLGPAPNCTHTYKYQSTKHS